jgi:hypothetical protein
MRWESNLQSNRIHVVYELGRLILYTLDNKCVWKAPVR